MPCFERDGASNTLHISIIVLLLTELAQLLPLPHPYTLWPSQLDVCVTAKTFSASYMPLAMGLQYLDNNKGGTLWPRMSPVAT